jgi:hypothetical protein
LHRLPRQPGGELVQRIAPRRRRRLHQPDARRHGRPRTRTSATTSSRPRATPRPNS